MYVPAYLWQYNLDTDGKGMLDPIPVITAKGDVALEPRDLSVAEIQSIANALLDQLQYSEDCNIMSGDILKAYGPEGIWNMQLISPDYSVVPVYSEEILDQIHNTTFVGTRPCDDAFNISLDQLRVTQVVTDVASSPYLVHVPEFGWAHHLGFDKVLDLHNENPTPEEILVATRNCVVGNIVSKAGNNRVFKVSACGSDLCLFGRVYYIDPNGGFASMFVYHSDFGNTNPEEREQLLTKFNKYPTYLWYPTDDIQMGTLPSGIAGEIDNYSVISHNTLKSIHETAMLALLEVPNSSRIRGN
jgi:hypothetical protein